MQNRKAQFANIAEFKTEDGQFDLMPCAMAQTGIVFYEDGRNANYTAILAELVKIGYMPVRCNAEASKNEKSQQKFAKILEFLFHTQPTEIRICPNLKAEFSSFSELELAYNADPRRSDDTGVPAVR